MSIHFFNPDHDIALALNLSRFSTPHVGRQMRSDLGYIPALWAEDGDIVIVEDIDAADLLYRRHNIASRAKVEFLTMEQLKNYDFSSYSIAPWGWNKSIRTMFLDAKTAKGSLPSEDNIDAIRQLSNRALAVELLKYLTASDGTIGTSHICTTKSEIDALLKQYKAIVIKAPWSSSGRGIRYIHIDDAPNENTQKWIDNTIMRQGTVIVEKKCHKVLDFAMEYYATPGGKVRYEGLSLFTTKNGAYTGNLLLPEEEKEERLAQYFSPILLEEIKEKTERFLSDKIQRAYVGPLGVDMMVCRDDSAPSGQDIRLNPCIEINMRRTMGHVALALSRKGQRGTMSIDYDGKNYRFHIRK